MTGDLRSRLKLYVIPDLRAGAPRSLMEQARAALAGGAGAVQLRHKTASGRELCRLGEALAALCDDAGALFFVNDRLDVALACGASGVHLGLEDLPVAVARRLAPPDFLVGATARTPEQALRAWKDGADYLGVGAVTPTPTKEDTTVIGPEGFAAVAASVPLPCVAVGGITAAAVPDLRRRGAAGVVVVREAVGAPDPAEACRRLRELLDA